MSIEKQLFKQFSIASLKNLYVKHVRLSGALGIDNLNQKAFWRIQDEQYEIINQKVLEGRYNFTKYRLKLISKGRAKAPRELSIPTIRDRIVLRGLCDFLKERFSNSVSFELPQDVIKKVNDQISSKKYSSFIKLDVQNFYPSIKHSELYSRLRKRINNQNALKLIHSALTTPTVARSSKYDTKANMGVPQGLAISNILSSIYLINIDRYMRKNPNIAYYRYVDDILILCNDKDSKSISKDLIKRMSKLGLKIHDPEKMPEKSKLGTAAEQFEYLGYEFHNGLVSCRKSSAEKLRESIVAIFNGYKYSTNRNIDFLLWRLNMRITGCIFEKKRKGWLFYFSQMNNEELLHELDAFILNLAQRFNVSINPKKFVRSYFQIKHQKHETQYVPNFDTYNITQMTEVLTKYFNKSTVGLEDEEIEFEFKKRIGKQVRDLLEDIQNPS